MIMMAGTYNLSIYVDGYIDIHGYGSVERAVDEVVILEEL